MQKNLFIGMDVGGSHIACAAIDVESKSIVNESYVHSYLDNQETADNILNSFADLLNQCLSKLDGNVKGIGIAMPGPFDYQNGIGLFEGSNQKFNNLLNVNVSEALEQKLQTKNLPIKYLNDASAFAIGESWFGAGKDTKKAVYITLGTGFGAAYIDDGKPIENRKDVAKNGCFWDIPYKKGIADDYFTTRWFQNEYKLLKNIEIEGAKTVFDEAKNDKEVLAIIDSYADNLAEFTSPYLKKFKAEKIVVGGSIAHSINMFANRFQIGLIKKFCFSKVVKSEYGENSILIGAAKYCLNNII